MIIGIVGKPSVGKSTFFKAATLADVDIANYPFTTIKPNHAVGFVKIDCVDQHFNKQCNPREGYCINHKRFVPVDLVDVAGLVPGAHEGLGMGSQFLSDLNQADALIHVIDISGSINEKGEPVEKLSYDPANDVRFLEEELDYWYLGIMKKGWEKFARTTIQEKKEIHKSLGKQLGGLGVNENMVEDIIKKLNLDKEKPLSWTEEELFQLARELRIRTKPMLIAANKIDVPGASDNLERLRKEFPEYTFVPCSSESELALKEAAKHGLIDYVPGENNYTVKGDLSEAQTKALEFIKTNMLDKFNTTGVQDTLNAAIFDVLKYIAIFPGGMTKLEDQHGNVLPDCFLLKEKSTALDFAFKIHTDLGKRFICAKDVKTRMTVGKDHVLKHRDVVEIVSDK
ncbi:redox-regulated ATPase YchF [Candidatus Woesearchaeota archaeon]|jgi:ribosome-binding ATPase|nr:redox-regulated ATPase YchF [Candidatus Woesearchaeota archaeon]MBT3537027.1 redox-regulated ATPase YchF [Candidatus Woesearchaeota archaeon]MBT4697637.1 redox-regulated ATPase YchF [Candidatus Woesearchaeota archaeon]MBT4716898.1 redox-regulated ATPase YchF [Candidatus Woesearchaeota archaeon]MBT7106663.1 redox-regulated ATPase YchF [Candidatus Woesearchaeota archaeon]